MKKRLTFIKYIFDEPNDTMIRYLFEEQKKETRKGDFINLINIDLKQLELNIRYQEIEKYSKSVWNNMINHSTERVALRNLIIENKTKSKTKHINYEQLEMIDYLLEKQTGQAPMITDPPLISFTTLSKKKRKKKKM